MVKPACERLWEVDALREGRLSPADAVAHERHRGTCSVCRERYAEDERLRDLGAELEPAPMEPLRARRLRAQVLRAAAEPPARSSQRWVFAIAAAVVLVVATLGVWKVRRAPIAAPAPQTSTVVPESFAGTIAPQPDTKWSRRRDGRVERVRIDDGELRIQVRKQEPDERFFVDLPDGEIEVRGTRFWVTVRGGETLSVRVEEGVVAFRRVGAEEILLHASESWEKPRSVEARRTPAPSTPVASVKTPSREEPRNDRATSVVAVEYESAVTSYREKRYPEAAQKFATFVSAHPGAAETEDAEFLEASALAHAGRPDAAALIAERFLAHHPSSFHAKDAAVLVARAARDRGDCAHARGVLAPWSQTPTPEATNALGACANAPE